MANIQSSGLSDTNTLSESMYQTQEFQLMTPCTLELEDGITVEIDRFSGSKSKVYRHGVEVFGVQSLELTVGANSAVKVKLVYFTNASYRRRFPASSGPFMLPEQDQSLSVGNDAS